MLISDQTVSCQKPASCGQVIDGDVMVDGVKTWAYKHQGL